MPAMRMRSRFNSSPSGERSRGHCSCLWISLVHTDPCYPHMHAGQSIHACHRRCRSPSSRKAAASLPLVLTHTSLTLTYSHSHSHYSNQSTMPVVDAAMLILGLRHEQSIVIKPKSLPAKTTGLVGPRRRAGRFGRREAIRARTLGGSALSLMCPPTVDKGERGEMERCKEQNSHPCTALHCTARTLPSEVVELPAPAFVVTITRDCSRTCLHGGLDRCIILAHE